MTMKFLSFEEFTFPDQDDQQHFCGLIFPIILYPSVKSVEFFFVNSTFVY